MSLARLGVVPVLGLLPLLGFGCSDPAPPTPRGAFTLNFADPGASCTIRGHRAYLGEVNEIEKTRVVADGESSAKVSCSVSGSGTFSVYANARNAQTAQEVTINIAAITPGATEDAPATGSVAFNSAESSGKVFVSDPKDPCRFWFEPDSDQGVDAGKIWVAFYCPTMKSDQNSGCRIVNGIAAFDSCGD